ncbi:MAG: hypothetical protein B7X60_01520 [Polynucleobacter sp. 39-45-136]|jgi:predicted dehydrogenase|nr:MAG: hypothetical protein B7X60_01520 [Polynucleobacter sp. 39-45-136]
MKIAIIGVGQLGSRHLQALSRLNFSAEIEVVDSSEVSIKIAKKRFAELPRNPHILGVKYLSSIAELSKSLDFTIIATNADVRASIIRELIKFCNLKYVLLEKVLFQKHDEYVEFLEIFENRQISAWVNHPRRQYPFYRELRKWVSGSEKISYHIQGGAWGLGCNGLHFIDHLAFLTGVTELELDSDDLDSTIMTSKRAGFVEFSGTLRGRMGKNTFTFFCSKSVAPMIISIYADKINVVIDESSGWIRIASKEGGWIWHERTEPIVCLQSELTNRVIEDVMETGNCELPSYADSVKLHRPFINCLKSHLESMQGLDYVSCPIT